MKSLIEKYLPYIEFFGSLSGRWGGYAFIAFNKRTPRRARSLFLLINGNKEERDSSYFEFSQRDHIAYDEQVISYEKAMSLIEINQELAFFHLCQWILQNVTAEVPNFINLEKYQCCVRNLRQRKLLIDLARKNNHFIWEPGCSELIVNKFKQYPYLLFLADCRGVGFRAEVHDYKIIDYDDAKGFLEKPRTEIDAQLTNFIDNFK